MPETFEVRPRTASGRVSAMRALMLGCVAMALLACGNKPEREHPLAAMAKSCAHDELSCPVPIFSVRDLRTSQRYYRDVLGFHVEWDYGEPADFGAVKRGSMVIFQCQGCQGNAGAWAMTFTKDVDKLHKEFVGKQAIIKMPPTNMEWNLREMHVADPDGNVIRFGGPIDHD